jgi:hypothetical protein
VDETGPGAFAQGKDLRRFSFEQALLLCRDRAIAQRGAPIGGSLKNG